MELSNAVTKLSVLPPRRPDLAVSSHSGRQNRRFSALWLPLLAAGLAAGCVGAPQDAGKGSGKGGGGSQPSGSTGSTGGPGGGSSPGDPGGPGAGPGGAGGPGTTPGAQGAGVSPLRRLTAEQYRNTVRDLLGLGADVVTTALPPDEAIANKFLSNVVRPVGPADLDKYADVAGLLAGKAQAKLDTLVPCAPAAGDAGCASRFIESFGRRAYRRPLSPVEVQRLEKVYQAGASFPNGVRLVIEALLQSPKFLYLVEPVPAGMSGQVVALDDWSVASRLSYFLWNSTPDTALLDAAQKGALNSPAGVASEAKRLMADPRFADSISSFHQSWLELTDLLGADKDPKIFPAWNPALKAAMAEETRRFVNSALGEGDGKLSTLLSAKWTFLSGPLYDLYGVAKPAGAAATDWQKVMLKGDERAGLLTQPGLMAALSKSDRTSFVRRGKMVREALFCQPIPDPPPGITDSDAMIPLTATAKERAAAHRQSPECAGCHALFDPLGFAFEPFDAIGRFRNNEGGKPIDSKLDLTGTSIDGSYATVVQLAERMGDAADVQACVARQWLRFALGREESPSDDGSLKDAVGRLKAGGGDVRELLFGLVSSSSFRFQTIQ
jgi:hypothetical protein